MKIHNVTSRAAARGISLIEALVALVILSIGLLALFNFQADLLRSGADAKARAEAVQLASNKLAELRELSASLSETAYDASTAFSNTTGEAVTGTNAAFTVSWDDADLSSPGKGKRISVMVSWTSPSGSEQVQQVGDVFWKDPATSRYLLSQQLPDGGGLSMPSGGAEYGEGQVSGDLLTQLQTSGNENQNSDGSGDGTIIHHTESPSRYELIDLTTGDILLTSVSEFIVIKGRVYLDSGARTAVADVKVGAPDVSWCTTTHNDPSGTPDDVLLDGASASFHYVSYACYVGAGWYGSLQILALDADGNDTWDGSDRGCLGEYGESDTGAIDSRHPQLSITRAYRGYNPNADYSVFAVSGIEGSLSGHDFLVTRITGSPTDSDCEGPLNITVAGSEFDFSGNPGDFYCLTSSCPNSLDATATPTLTTISGTVDLDYALTSAVTSDAIACTSSETAGDPDFIYSVSCTVYDLGSGWRGRIYLNPEVENDIIYHSTVTDGTTFAFP